MFDHLVLLRKKKIQVIQLLMKMVIQLLSEKTIQMTTLLLSVIGSLTFIILDGMHSKQFLLFLFSAHHVNTSLDLVGLQVWRGALLLADLLIHSSTDDELVALKITPGDCILELGAGTGLTSIVAGQVSNLVVSTGKT